MKTAWPAASGTIKSVPLASSIFRIQSITSPSVCPVARSQSEPSPSSTPSQLCLTIISNSLRLIWRLRKHGNNNNDKRVLTSDRIKLICQLSEDQLLNELPEGLVPVGGPYSQRPGRSQRIHRVRPYHESRWLDGDDKVTHRLTDQGEAAQALFSTTVCELRPRQESRWDESLADPH